MIANLVPVVVLAAVLIGYFVYMKCFYPRFRQRCEAAADRAEAVWRERGEVIVGEYLRDPDRFGKIAEVLGETPVRGLISTSAPKQGLGERIGKGIVGAVTFTRETDLGHYYFVAADDGLHLLGFDGERCFLNEVYAAGEIRRARLEPRTFSFDYKGGTVRMEVPNGGLAEGYPRFRIHEYDKVPTSSDRATNYFVREYFACEPTGNLAYRQAQSAVPRFTGLNVSEEQLIDRKVRTALLEGFRRQLGIV